MHPWRTGGSALTERARAHRARWARIAPPPTASARLISPRHGPALAARGCLTAEFLGLAHAGYG